MISFNTACMLLYIKIQLNKPQKEKFLKKTEDGQLSSAMKENARMSSVVLDASVDPNTFDMLSLARVCPAEKRLSTALLYSRVEVGRALADKIVETNLPADIYITGNNAKTIRAFDINHSDVVEWLVDVITETMKSVKIEKIVTDFQDGVGAAAAEAGQKLGIQVDGYGV